MWNFNFVFLLVCFVKANKYVEGNYAITDVTICKQFFFLILFLTNLLICRLTEAQRVFGCICEYTRPHLFFNHPVSLSAKKLDSQWRRDGGLCFQVRRRSRARRWMSCLWSCRFCGWAVKSISSSDTMRFSSCAAKQCWMSLSFQPLNNVLVLWETLIQIRAKFKFPFSPINLSLDDESLY